MSKKYLIPAAILVLLGVVLAFSEVKYDIKEETSPQILHFNITEHTRYVNVEEIAHKLIDKDPLLMLIDVRSAKEFAKFSLSGAINIPLDSLLLPVNEDYLAQDIYDAVFYSNGTLSADQAWIICKRLGYTNNYVMKGGLNAWVEDILQPQTVEGIFDNEEDDLYQLRKGASQYFGGGSGSGEAEDDGKAKPKKKVKKRKKKGVEGGCG